MLCLQQGCVSSPCLERKSIQTGSKEKSLIILKEALADIQWLLKNKSARTTERNEMLEELLFTRYSSLTKTDMSVGCWTC